MGTLVAEVALGAIPRVVAGCGRDVLRTGEPGRMLEESDGRFGTVLGRGAVEGRVVARGLEGVGDGRVLGRVGVIEGREDVDGDGRLVAGAGRDELGRLVGAGRLGTGRLVVLGRLGAGRLVVLGRLERVVGVGRLLERVVVGAGRLLERLDEGRLVERVVGAGRLLEGRLLEGRLVDRVGPLWCAPMSWLSPRCALPGAASAGKAKHRARVMRS